MGWKHNMPNNGENMITVQTSNQSNECIIFLQNRRSHNRAISRKKPNMAQALEFHRGQIEALMRAMSVAKIIREDKDPCMIEEGLYLGSLGAANNKDALKRLNLTHILTIARELNPPYPNEFVYKVLAVHDRVDANISHYFEECFDFIEEAKGQGGGVLVHCFAGKSRSATIVIAYLMKKHGMSHSEAFQLVKSRRPVVSPNAGFMTQLENYDKTLKVEPAPSLCPASLNAALTILKISLHKQVATKQSKRRRSTASLEHFAHEAPVDNM
ncbi:dual specificity protein phosphatase 1-like isoform X4 [Lycium barbarum]|uniref:dual specificity protein phosphatase 1-like isoform X4 n=1 Tax=Lycium barbarum TaxID=112863 RepID=UPI00293E8869|nr:dual specificity protein phosphatase 1-like isoform X4 [Lycium barbarum]